MILYMYHWYFDNASIISYHMTSTCDAMYRIALACHIALCIVAFPRRAHQEHRKLFRLESTVNSPVSGTNGIMWLRPDPVSSPEPQVEGSLILEPGLQQGKRILVQLAGLIDLPRGWVSPLV